MLIPIETVLEVQNLCRLNPKVEVCGLIDSTFRLHPISNASKSPQYCFVFEKRGYFTALKCIAAQGLSILAVYHTHPVGCDSTPSKADLDFVKNSKRNSLIVSAKDYRWIEYAN